jgi:2-polyprenyl-3-methyl-5-hydroxy-6-metoxy-1,4-benzoquinol methylase
LRHEVARESWEREYASGAWDYLRSIDVMAHYSVVMGYVLHFNARARILDIGCGEGILQQLLQHSYSRYLGLDLSAEAIRRAGARTDTTTDFRQGDAALFSPSERFDAIVFNEVLYYFERPLDIVERYANVVSPEGVVIISNVIRRRSVLVRRALARRYAPLARVTLANSRGDRWEIQVIRPGTG